VVWKLPQASVATPVAQVRVQATFVLLFGAPVTKALKLCV
jgi:hypothetical protein